MNERLDVSASCEDTLGRGDAAYPLCGEFTPEELCRELLATLRAGWGLTNAQGEVTLTLSIRLAAPVPADVAL